MTLEVVPILGMHRSGTSLVARVVNLLGLSLGAEENLMPAKPDNPSGFWENLSVTAFNDDLLAELGGRWDEPPIPPDGWEESPRLDPWRRQARTIVERDFEGVGRAAWKDPRLSILLPFWTTVVDVNEGVIVVREPTAVARSLSERDDMPRDRASALWISYTAAAMRHSPNGTAVRYDDFFRDLDGTVIRLADALRLPPPTPETRTRIDEFFDVSLRHHASTDGSSEPESQAARWLFEATTTPFPKVVADLLWFGSADLHPGAFAKSTLVGRLDALEQQRESLSADIVRLENSHRQVEASLDMARRRLDAQGQVIERTERSLVGLRTLLTRTQGELDELKSNEGIPE